MQHEISQASDIAARRYIDKTPAEERTNRGVADAMRSAAEEKVTKLRGKMGKLLAVADPAFGKEFLEQVIL